MATPFYYCLFWKVLTRHFMLSRVIDLPRDCSKISRMGGILSNNCTTFIGTFDVYDP